MTVTDFLASVEQNAMWWAEDGDDYLVCIPFLKSETGEPPTHRCTKEGIEGADWPTLRRKLLDGYDCTGFTRIVGYYSRTVNWNLSKLGELADRQRGIYTVTTQENPVQTLSEPSTAPLNVLLFGRALCGECQKAKALLAEAYPDFEYHDVGTAVGLAEALFYDAGDVLPVVVILRHGQESARWAGKCPEKESFSRKVEPLTVAA